MAVQEAPLFPGAPSRSVTIQTVQHDIPDDFRRNILPLKQKADCIEHGSRAAIVFTIIITSLKA